MPTLPPTHTNVTEETYRWVLAATSFVGMTLAIVLSVVLLLTAVIMLVGRLIGVSHVTSAFVWSVFLAVILFPWQSLLNAHGSDRVPDQKIPGALMTWSEVDQVNGVDGGAKFSTGPVTPAVILHWARFAAYPLFALILLFTVQMKSGRGLRFALGEADIPVDVGGVAKPGDVVI